MIRADLTRIIAGPETGKGPPRSMDLDWVRRVRDEAVQAGVPFFVKQLSDQHGDHAVRELEGRTWDAFSEGFVKLDSAANTKKGWRMPLPDIKKLTHEPGL